MTGRILIVDAVATNRIVLKSKLVAACYVPLLATDGRACLTTARRDRPQLILLDLHLSDMPGIEVLRQLRADPLTAAIPVIIWSGDMTGAERLAAIEAGADDVVPKSIDDHGLLARVRGLMRSSHAVEAMQQDNPAMGLLGLAEAAQPFSGPGLVAIVSDRPDRAMRLRRDLQRHCSDRIVTMSRLDALADQGVALAQDRGVDVFVVDGDPGGPEGGLRLVADLRSRQSTLNAAIAVLAGPDEGQSAVAFDMGANDLWSDRMDPHEQALRLRRLIQRKREADRLRSSVEDGLRLAMVDPLTGLHNRRFAMSQLAAMMTRSRDQSASLSVMVIDLDRFKSVNDRWGHAAGDAVLVAVSARLAGSLRDGDLLARVGGEEFLVALPDTPLPAAAALAERLRDSVRGTRIALPSGEQVQVTVSIGLAAQDPQGGFRLTIAETVAQVVERADHALLIAKSAGRNQVTVGRTAA